LEGKKCNIFLFSFFIENIRDTSERMREYTKSFFVVLDTICQNGKKEEKDVVNVQVICDTSIFID